VDGLRPSSTANHPASLKIRATVIAIFPFISNTTPGLRSVDPGLRSYFGWSRSTNWLRSVALA